MRLRPSSPANARSSTNDLEATRMSLCPAAVRRGSSLTRHYCMTAANRIHLAIESIGELSGILRGL